MAGDCKQFSRCSLDTNGCLQLSSVLQSFSAAVSEEQAWAVCFQSAKCMVNEWNSDSGSCYCFSDTSHVLIHKDGFIHRSTVKLSGTEAGNRQLATSEYQLVATLGMIVFSALDYMLPMDEERKLSRPLESLIEKMTSTSMPSGDGDCDEADSSSQNADEGIEQDSGEDDHILHTYDETDAKQRRGLSLVQVMELCASHLSCPEQADCHYKAVCRALVAEVLELTTFLENISNKTQILSHSGEDEADSRTLEKLRIQDWARLWMQVIHQLRQGVKLKKVDAAHLHSIEYALTPYEMLLDDIRSRRYKLRQVMVNGDIPPRVKKDAHALILDFIRSRPPLVPVSKRKLPPTPPRTLTLYEKLMASIKQQHKLKPTVPSSSENNNKRKIETSRTKLEDTDETPQPQRRLIKADINLGFSSSFEDLDDIPQTPLEAPQSLPLQNGTNKLSSLIRSNSHTDSLSRAERRHSISVCESPPKSGDQTPQEDINGHFSAFYQHSSREARSDYWKSSQWQSLECLSLTLEEVVHIRNVLTKAELESLVVDSSLYEEVRKGKVCFTCKQVRFSFFGAWGVKCKMCERTVCDKCSSKMRIPTEHFARIPVYMLSPTPSPPPEEESSHTFWKFSDVFGKSEVKENIQTTPKLSRQKTTFEDDTPKRRLTFRHSESVHVIANKNEPISNRKSLPPESGKRPPLHRSKTIVAPETVSSSDISEEKMKGPLVPVCRECKVMVCNIIMASQDKVSFKQSKRKNSRTWPRKRSGGATHSFMDTVTETPPSSPDDIFASDSRNKYTP